MTTEAVVGDASGHVPHSPTIRPFYPHQASLSGRSRVRKTPGTITPTTSKNRCKKVGHRPAVRGFSRAGGNPREIKSGMKPVPFTPPPSCGFVGNSGTGEIWGPPPTLRANLSWGRTGRLLLDEVGGILGLAIDVCQEYLDDLEDGGER